MFRKSHQLESADQGPPLIKKQKMNFDISQYTNSVVEISATKLLAKYDEPWQSPQSVESGGSGVVIDQESGYILTCAHVGDPRYIVNVRLGSDTKKYPAKVVVFEPDSDLTILQVKDREFTRKAKALELGEFQGLGKSITIIGYPGTGVELAATTGTVSGNEIRGYVVGEAANLASMVTAPMNPGNSGGPVVDAEEKLVGIAFQGISPSEAELAAFMIPVPVIQQFLKGARKTLETGVPCTGVPDLPATFQNMINPALHKVFRMQDHHSGIRVCNIDPLADLGGLQKNDIILELDGHKISNDGKILSLPQISDRLDYVYLIGQKQIGESIPAKILRNGTEMALSIPLKYHADELKLIGRREFRKQATYYIKNGLCFQPVTHNFCLTDKGISLFAMIESKYGRMTDVPKEMPGQQLIAITHVFNAELTSGYDTPESCVFVSSINGHAINNIRDVIMAMENKNAPTVNIKLKAAGKEIVLFKARPEQELDIKQEFGIAKTYSDDLEEIILTANQAAIPVAQTQAPVPVINKAPPLPAAQVAMTANTSSVHKVVPRPYVPKDKSCHYDVLEESGPQKVFKPLFAVKAPTGQPSTNTVQQQQQPKKQSQDEQTVDQKKLAPIFGIKRTNV